MKNIIFVLFTLISSTTVAQAPIVLTGHYQGMNICIQNAPAQSGIGYSVYRVEVNGDVCTDEINKEYFIINFLNLNLKIDDPISLRVLYTNGAPPKILNPMVVKPKSAFETVYTYIDSDEVFTWTTINENGSLPFIIEQYRWNKWVKIGEIKGKGTAEKNTYKYKIIPHSGENKFRVSQVDYTRKRRRSETVIYNRTDLPEILISGSRHKIILSDKTYYEVFDVNGEFIKKGFDSVIDLSFCKRGLYYLNVGSRTGEVWNIH